MRPLVLVRSSKTIGSSEAISFIEAFVETDRSLQYDLEGQLDLIMTNRERLSMISADIIAKLHIIKDAIAEEADFKSSNTVAPSNNIIKKERRKKRSIDDIVDKIESPSSNLLISQDASDITSTGTKKKSKKQKTNDV